MLSERDHFHLLQAASQEAFAYGLEAQGDVADVEAVVGRAAAAVVEQAVGAEGAGGGFGGGGGGIDEGEAGGFLAGCRRCRRVEPATSSALLIRCRPRRL